MVRIIKKIIIVTATIEAVLTIIIIITKIIGTIIITKIKIIRRILEIIIGKDLKIIVGKVLKIIIRRRVLTKIIITIVIIINTIRRTKI